MEEDGRAAPVAGEAESLDYVYWTGCAANYDVRIAAIVRATVRVLRAGGLRVRFLGEEEACTGDAARRLGEEGLFQQLALQNIETLQRHGAARVVTHCAHCFHVFRNEYPKLGADFEVVHHSELIARLIDDGRVRLKPRHAVPVTLHDSCYVGRYNRIFDAPRTALRAAYGGGVREMPRHGPQSFCCGAGGANYWYDVPNKEPVGVLRAREALATGARVIAAECPFCVKMLEQGAKTVDPSDQLQVKDIAELVAEALDEEQTGGMPAPGGPAAAPRQTVGRA
jgi:Fe-S oxidoreductase